jgi:hypothetical protein
MTLQDKIAQNIWDHFSQVLPIIIKASKGQWAWLKTQTANTSTSVLTCVQVTACCAIAMEIELSQSILRGSTTT